MSIQIFVFTYYLSTFLPINHSLNLPFIPHPSNARDR